MIVNAEMQQQARALGDPSRFRLFAHIAAAQGPVMVAELTELLEFNHNAVRQHLAILVEAKLIHESNEVRTSRGRPRKQYELRSDAMASFRSIGGSYERLAEILLELSKNSDSPYDVGLRSGTREAIEATQGIDQAATSLSHRLALDGFEPVLADDASMTLMHCPFADVAAQDPGVVCEIHRGLIDGMLSEQPDRLVGELAVRPAHQAGCGVHLRSLG